VVSFLEVHFRVSYGSFGNGEPFLEPKQRSLTPQLDARIAADLKDQDLKFFRKNG
jgi:hypothetical protein